MSPSDTALVRQRRGALSRLLPLALIGLGMAAFFALGLHRELSLEALRDNREALRALVAAHGVLAAAGFVTLYAVVVACSLPAATLLTLAGGLLFGLWLGTALVLAGATLGAVAVFLAARSAFAGVLRRRAGPWLGAMAEGFRRNALSYMLVLRLVPLFPFFVVNLVPAFLGVPLRIYVLGTVLGIIPGTFVYVGVGNGLGAVFAAGGRPDLSILYDAAVLGPMLGLAALSLLPVAYRALRRPA